MRTTYLSDCATCHGNEGRGTPRGTSLVGQGGAAVDYALSTGRMPLIVAGRSEEPGRPKEPRPDAFIGQPSRPARRSSPAYPPEMIAALVDYVSQLTGGAGPDIPTVSPGDVALGGEQFRLQCAACHSWAGTGGALAHREAPPLAPATPVQVAEAMRVGPGQMPAFGDAALSNAQVDDVVAYVQLLDHAPDRGGFALGHLGPVAEGAVAFVGLALFGWVCRWIGVKARTNRDSSEGPG